MTIEKDTTQPQRIHSQNFSMKNRKMCWEEHFHNGECCIGENAVKSFLMEKDDEIEALRMKIAAMQSKFDELISI